MVLQHAHTHTHTHTRSPKSPNKIGPSPFKSIGSAETGVLQRRTPMTTPSARPKAEEVSTPRREITLYANATPTRAGNFYSSPRVGVGGEQLSQWQTPKPAFPLNIQPSAEEPEGAKPTEHVDHTPSFRQTRQLSIFEEESETESIPDARPHSISPQSHSPLRSPRSRRLLNSKSSPLVGLALASKSDPSDDEEEDDDDIVELMTTSGRFSKASTFPRLSPSTSPLLTSRRSPTHCWTGSSDEELSNIFESTHKHRNKRLAYHRKRGPPLARVDSVSSDDGGGKRDRQRRPTSRNREKLLRMRQYNSLPETSASESLTELLENIRRQRSGSTRTDSSLSDHEGIPEEVSEGGRNSKAGEKAMNDLANSLVSKFDLSDDEVEKSSEMETEGSRKRTAHPLKSAYCCVL